MSGYERPAPDTTPNPHDMYSQPNEWAFFEYHHCRGNLYDLRDLAKRKILLRDFQMYESLEPIIKYLLKLEDQ